MGAVGEIGDSFLLSNGICVESDAKQWLAYVLSWCLSSLRGPKKFGVELDAWRASERRKLPLRDQSIGISHSMILVYVHCSVARGIRAS